MSAGTPVSISTRAKTYASGCGQISGHEDFLMLFGDVLTN